MKKGGKKTKEKATLDITHYQSLSDEEIKKITDELKNKNLYTNIVFEASGNINENNIKEFM